MCNSDITFSVIIGDLNCTCKYEFGRGAAPNFQVSSSGNARLSVMKLVTKTLAEEELWEGFGLGFRARSPFGEGFS